jgi:hypothetical protein
MSFKLQVRKNSGLATRHDPVERSLLDTARVCRVTELVLRQDEQTTIGLMTG